MNAVIAVSQHAGGSGKDEATTLGAVTTPENMKDAGVASATGTADRNAASGAADLAGLAVVSAKAGDAYSMRAM
jgi:hypothetical protein